MKKKTQSLWSYVQLVFYYIFMVVKKIYLFFVDFFGPVVDSVYGKVNQKELFRILQLSAASGGSLWQLLELLGSNSGKFISDPILSEFFKLLTTSDITRIAIIFALVVFLLDFLRRRRHTAHKKVVKKRTKKPIKERTV